MLYRKNLYSWEQWLRILAGIAMAVGGVLLGQGGIVGYGVAASGLMLALTGVFGFCPACAMVGRKPVAQPFKRKGHD